VTLHEWWGGDSSGPRYLVPGLALLAPWAARAFERWPRATAVLALVSLANALAVTAVSTTSLWHGSPCPLAFETWPYLLGGTFRRANVGMSLGLSGRASLLPGIALLAVLGALLARAVRAAPRDEV
jgi:hypothetical protein